jgi:hypothetical protein
MESGSHLFAGLPRERFGREGTGRFLYGLGVSPGTAPWKPGGARSTSGRRNYRRSRRTWQQVADEDISPFDDWSG